MAPEITIHRNPIKALGLFNEDRLRWLDRAMDEGPVTALRFGPIRTWVVTDPDAVRTMALTDGADWTRALASRLPVRLGGGENLFSQSDKAWQLLQPEVSPAFRAAALQPRMEKIGEIIDEELAALPRDEELDLDLVTGRLALMLAAWILLGDRLSRGRAEEIHRHERAAIDWVANRIGGWASTLPVAAGPAYRRLKQHRAEVEAYVQEIIDRRSGEDDVLGALVAARPGGRPLSPKHLRSHVLGLFMAGNETTGAALSWILVHAARHREHWHDLRQHPDGTANFVTESLRVTPAVWGFAVTPTRKGVTIRSGDSTVSVGRAEAATAYIRGMNLDPGRWSDPERFDPRRHEDASVEQRRGLLNFGLGPRGCIGQHMALYELEAIVPVLAKAVDVEIVEPTAYDASFALRVAGGLRGRLADPS